MSEYFTVSFEVEKSKTVFERFYKAMIASGVTYKSGFMSFKPESFQSQIGSFAIRYARCFFDKMV